MIKNLLIVFLSIFIINCLPQSDLISSPPGMIGAVLYSGYLKTATLNREIHYVYVQANLEQPMSAPLTIWLNGGPGCSSLIGMIQQIGPFIVGNSYKLGDLLTKNQYSWNKISNLLFLESPAAVGFSSDKNFTYHWTDQQTAQDALEAIKDFLFNKAPEFSNSSLYISGQSYAGKYIPDITNLIILQNKDPQNKPINIKGIMVGNGVMNFENDELYKSQIQYMLDHQQFSTRLQSIYERTCSRDFDSPRCRFLQYQFEVFQAYLDPYDVYKVCQTKPAEAISLLHSLNSQQNNIQRINLKNGTMLKEIPECPSDDGAVSYWNLNKIPFKVNKYNKTWSPCSHINYTISLRGSIKQYSNIIKNKVKVWFFSGDWDDVVPFTDTQKNVKKLNRNKIGQWNSWNVLDQHAGHYQIYDSDFTVITVTKAGHMVPQTQPKASYQLFYNFINNKGVNNQVF